MSKQIHESSWNIREFMFLTLNPRNGIMFGDLYRFLLVGMFGEGSLDEMATVYLTRNEDRSVMCSICGKTSRDYHAGKAHLESKHFTSESRFDCEYCGKQYKTKNSLSCHISQYHRNKWANGWLKICELITRFEWWHKFWWPRSWVHYQECGQNVLVFSLRESQQM